MDALHGTGVTLHMAVALVITVAAYALIFSEVIHRTSAAIMGAVLMVGVGMWLGFHSQEAALASMDTNTLLLLMGMMLIITMLRPTGGFDYLAIRMIGSAAGLSFNDFLIRLGPVIVIAWVVGMGALIAMFPEQFGKGRPSFGELALDEARAIKQPGRLAELLLALGIVVALFFVHHHIGLRPAYVAFIGVAIALPLVRPHPEELFGQVHWSVLVFFGGLFVIVGGLESSGLLRLIGERMASLAHAPGRLLLTCLLLMWLAALVSAVVDNIPFTLTMIPIVQSLGAYEVDIVPLWWALALGAGLGENRTHVGATANIICVSESEEVGIPEARITPVLWLRKGLPVTVLTLLVASVVFAAFFPFFRSR